MTGIGSSSEGTLWVAVSKKGLQRYDRETGEWHTARGRSSFGRVSKEKGEWCITGNKEDLTCLAVGEGFMAVGARDTGSHSGTSFQVGSVDIYYPMSGTWRHVRRSEGLPDASVYSLAVQRKTLWIGGWGYVAAHVLDARRIRHVYTVPGKEPARTAKVRPIVAQETNSGQGQPFRQAHNPRTHDGAGTGHDCAG